MCRPEVARAPDDLGATPIENEETNGGIGSFFRIPSYFRLFSFQLFIKPRLK